MSSPENITLEVRLDPHNTRTDFAFFDDALKDGVDIYIPEHNAYTQESAKGYKKIASGDSKVYQKVKERLNPDSMFAAQLSALFASRVQVELFDIPAAEYYANPIALTQLKDREQGVNGSSVNHIVDRFLTTLDLSSRTNTFRNEGIANNLITRLPGFVAQHPRLSQKDEVNVLVTMGDLHLQLPSLLGNDFKVTSNEVIQSDLSAEEQCAVKTIYGEELVEGLVYQGVAAVMLSPYVHGESTAMYRKIMNKIVQGVESDEVAEILEARSRGINAVHGLLRDRIAYLGIDADRDFQLVKPGSYTQYVPRMVNERVKGRTVAVSSLF